MGEGMLQGVARALLVAVAARKAVAHVVERSGGARRCASITGGSRMHTYDQEGASSATLGCRLLVARTHVPYTHVCAARVSVELSLWEARSVRTGSAYTGRLTATRHSAVASVACRCTVTVFGVR